MSVSRSASAAPSASPPRLADLAHYRSALEAAVCPHQVDLMLLGVHLRLLTDDPALAEVISSTYVAPLFAPPPGSRPLMVFRAVRAHPAWPLILSWNGRACFVSWNAPAARFDQLGVYWDSGVKRPEGYFATRDLTPASATPEAVTDLFAVVVERRLLSEALARRRQHYLVHAGVVAGKQGAALLVGGSMQGKTTLTLALAACGQTFLSDDFAPVDGATGLVHPFPTALRVRDATLALLPEVHLPVLHWQVDANGHRRAYLDPYTVLRVADGPLPLCSVFLLQGFAEMPQAKVVDCTHALFQSLRCANLPVREPGVALLSLSPHFARARCFSLLQGSPQATAELVSCLMEGAHG